MLHLSWCFITTETRRHPGRAFHIGYCSWGSPASGLMLIHPMDSHACFQFEVIMYTATGDIVVHVSR